MKVVRSKDGAIKEIYFLNGDVLVHRHIHYPGEFLVTIRKLDIHGRRMCKDNLDEESIKKEIVGTLDNIIMHHQYFRDRLLGHEI